METFTIAEAAELTGLTKKAMRHRVDRGQVRAVKYGGVRRISRAELDRVGLTVARVAHDDRDVATLQRTLKARERELDDLRGQLEAALSARAHAEADAARAQATLAAEIESHERLVEAEPLERRRLLRELEPEEPECEVFFRRGWLAEEVPIASQVNGAQELEAVDEPPRFSRFADRRRDASRAPEAPMRHHR